MRKGIFAQSWQAAMQRHYVYKKEQLKKIEVVKKEIRKEMDKNPAGFLGGIGLYYIQRFKIVSKKIFKGKK